MYEMSARPSRTASKVPGAAATPLGRMLHFMRPALSFSSRSHQLFCAMLSVCVGGTQLETVKTVWAEATPPASTVVDSTAVARQRSFMGSPGRVRG
ncbi:hypothetical protein ACFJGX_22285 [Hydrogenophaga sp. UC242_50]|uniref:hypothetical protein n=1 Tax=Hydrogenophaga sp. UC242_50 TaxID=3350169 RepID=UPI0036D37D1E